MDPRWLRDQQRAARTATSEGFSLVHRPQLRPMGSSPTYPSEHPTENRDDHQGGDKEDVLGLGSERTRNAQRLRIS